MKKEYLISGLDSIETLDKIEQQIYSKHKNLNFSIDKETSILSLEYENENVDIVFHIEEILETFDAIFMEINAKPTIRRVFILGGLDCANCASKIERIAKRTIEHKLIVVDFATARFIIETEDIEGADGLIEEIQTIASSVDHAVKVKTNQEHKDKENKLIKLSKWDKISFIIGAILFILGVIAKFSLFQIWNIEIPVIYGSGFFLIAYVFLGYDVITGAIKNIANGRVFDEKFLMTLATLVALGIGFYEEAVSVMIFYKVGELLQKHAVNKSRKSIASLIDIQPSIARIIVEGETFEVDPLGIVVGDIIIVKAGEIIPLDGVVISGEAALDVSALTGEGKYLEVFEGSSIVSGSINTNGVLKIRVEKVYNDSTVSQILKMVEGASESKAQTENFITKFARYYTPVVVIMAFLWALSPFVLKSAPVWGDFQKSIYAAMVFLVASCPCALLISIPLGFFGGIGGASKHGILIKGSNYLEALSNVGTVVFDKTGTLTKGEFSIEEIVSESKEDVLMLAAYCELSSNHPIAKSIVAKYGRNNIDEKRIGIHPKNSKLGAKIYLDQDDITLGNDIFMGKSKIKIPKIESDGVVVYVAKNDIYVGYLILKDIIREEAKQAVAMIKAMGINVAMITGDKQNVASKVANELGIKQVYAEMMPVDKVKKLRKMRKDDNKKQVFIGDGINDAPVLSNADIGIAMGALGSDAAIKVADIVLMDDNLLKIPLAIKIANKTKMIVYQNIIFALSVKAIVLVLAPFGIAHMWEAIFADVGVSLLAILNSLRAARIKE